MTLRQARLPRPLIQQGRPPTLDRFQVRGLEQKITSGEIARSQMGRGGLRVASRRAFM